MQITFTLDLLKYDYLCIYKSIAHKTLSRVVGYKVVCLFRKTATLERVELLDIGLYEPICCEILTKWRNVVQHHFAR